MRCLRPRTRIPNVSAWTAKYIGDVTEDAGNVARAISETSETLSLGRASITTAR
jgi:hypothetical protein